jgi:hypothetical protein
MNALLLPTATDRDASAPALGSVQSMSMMSMSKWSKPRNLTGATSNHCTLTSSHCTFTGIYGAKRVATGSLPEGLT